MRKRITRRIAEEKVSQETIVAEQLVKLAKELLAQEEEDDGKQEEPKLKELKMSIRTNLTKFNKPALLKKKLQSVLDDVSSGTIKQMTVQDLFETMLKITSM